MSDIGGKAAAFGMVALLIFGAWMWGLFVPTWLWVLVAFLVGLSVVGLVEAKKEEEARRFLTHQSDALLGSHIEARRHLKEAVSTLERLTQGGAEESPDALELRGAIRQAVEALERGSKHLEYPLK